MSEPENTDDGPTGPSDEDLKAIGLTRTKAWVRVTETGPARRARRYRDRAPPAAQGQRQLSTTVPQEARETVRQIYRRLCEGNLSLADLVALQASNAHRSEADQVREARLPAAARIDRKRIGQIWILAATSLAAFTAGMTIALGLI